MRVKSLTSRALLVVTALAAAFVVAPATAAQAACSFSVSSLAWNPSSVSNTADATLNLTLKATAGFSSISVDMLPPHTGGLLKPVAGSAGTYQGSIGLVRGTAPGSYGLTSMVTANSQCYLATFSAGYDADQLTALGLPRLTVTGSATAVDTQPPAVGSFTGGTGTYDATRGASIPVSVHATDDASGVKSVTVIAVGTTDASLPSPYDAAPVSGVDLTRSSGTDLDGVWTGSMPLVAGSRQSFTYYIDVVDRVGRSIHVSPPAGSPTGFATVTTAAPAKPTGLKAVTGYASSIGTLPGYTGYYVGVTWAAPGAGQVGATDYRLTTSGSCASVYWYFSSATSAFITKGASSGVCTVTLTAHNTAGTSPSASASAVL